MKELALVSSSLIRPVYDRLRSDGLRANQLLEQSGLSARAFEMPQAYLPRASVHLFAKMAVRTTGEEMLFYECGASAAGQLLQISPAMVLDRELTAFEYLKRALETGARMSTAVRLCVRVAGDVLWLERVTTEPRQQENWNFEQYAMRCLEGLVSEIFGSGISPIAVRLRATPEPSQLPLHWRDVPVRIGQAISAIGYPIGIILSAGSVQKAVPEKLAFDTGFEGVSLNSLEDAISLYVMDRGAGIDNIASAFGMNRRTFQRHLAGLGLTFSELVEESRFKRVMQFIESQDDPISEIAAEAGYSNAENFSRAFRRRYGLPPTQYRKLFNRAGDN